VRRASVLTVKNNGRPLYQWESGKRKPSRVVWLRIQRLQRQLANAHPAECGPRCSRTTNFARHRSLAFTRLTTRDKTVPGWNDVYLAAVIEIEGERCVVGADSGCSLSATASSRARL